MIEIKADQIGCKISVEGTPKEVMSELCASTLEILENLSCTYPAKSKKDREEFREFVFVMYKDIFVTMIDGAL